MVLPWFQGARWNRAPRKSLVAVLLAAALGDVAVIGAQDFLVARHQALTGEGFHLLALAGGEMAPDVELGIDEGVLVLFGVVVLLGAGAVAPLAFLAGIVAAAFVLFLVLVVFVVALLGELVVVFLVFLVVLLVLAVAFVLVVLLVLVVLAVLTAAASLVVLLVLIVELHGVLVFVFAAS